MLICVLQLYNHFCKCSPCSSCHLRFRVNIAIRITLLQNLTQCWYYSPRSSFTRGTMILPKGFNFEFHEMQIVVTKRRINFRDNITTIYKSPSLEEAAWRTRPKLCEIHCKDCCAYSQNSRCSWRLFDGTGWTQTHLRNPPHCTEDLRTWRVD